jgi:signal transduction histidine kinase
MSAHDSTPPTSHASARVTLESTRVVLVTNGSPFADGVAESLRAAGCDVTVGAADRDLWSVLAGSTFDAIVLDDDAALRGLVRALEEEPRTRAVPTVSVREPGSAATLRASESLSIAEGGRELLELLARAIGEAHQRRPPKPPNAQQRAASVAHDVRTLLGIVVGLAANLRDGIAGGLDAIGREHAQKIVAAVTDASALLDQLAERDEPTHGGPRPPPRADTHRAELELVSLVRSVLSLFEGYAVERGVELRFEWTDAVYLWGHPLQLKQVTTNLLVNAIKLTPRGGVVTVTVRITEAPEGRGREGRRVAELVVSDTGPGIPPSERERVFERGVRLARDEGVPGSGIGLAVVRDLVGRHGGKSALQASPSGGAEFVVRLPLDLRARALDEANEPDLDDAPEPSPRRALREPS